MDTIKLKDTIKKQKKDFSTAVEEKLAYLKSDDVFKQSEDYYAEICNMHADNVYEDVRLKSLFEESIKSIERKTAETLVNSAFSSNNTVTKPQIREAKNPDEYKKKMSMSERIAALRGSLNVHKY